MSSFETYQKKLKEKIKLLEEENISKKAWTLSGEITARDRPINSLLEENLEFEQVSKPVPIITEKTVESLEDLIKKRILDELWDDPQKTPAPITNKHARKEGPSTEKSKDSLAQIYEAEYRQKAAKGGIAADPLAGDKKKIQDLWTALNYKLNNLSNFYFTAKPTLNSELAEVANVPSVLLEETLPLLVNENMTLAPEEVYATKQSSLTTPGERTQKDRHSHYLKKKSKFKKAKLFRSAGKPKSTLIVANNKIIRKDGEKPKKKAF